MQYDDRAQHFRLALGAVVGITLSAGVALLWARSRRRGGARSVRAPGVTRRRFQL